MCKVKEIKSNHVVADGNDPRHTFTPWERESVRRLKEACDNNGVAYNSLFELAKYVLVSKSAAKDTDPKADAKRLQVALERITKKRQWEQETGANEVDIQAAYEELEEKGPQYGLFRYLHDKEQRGVVGYHFAYAPTDYVKEHKLKSVLVALIKTELAAANMEEARRGIAMVGICEGKVGISEAIRYVQVLKACKRATEPMHANRVRKIYVQAPSLLANLVNAARVILPKKLRARLVLVSHMSALEKYMDLKETTGRQVTAKEWYEERTKLYNETVSKLTI